MKRYITVASLLLCLIPAAAGFVDGNKLNALAQADARASGPQPTNKDLGESLSFHGYLRGVYDSYEGVAICAPDKFAASQMAAIVTKYLKNNPEKWNLPGDGLVVSALTQVFPCPKK